MACGSSGEPPVADATQQPAIVPSSPIGRLGQHALRCRRVLTPEAGSFDICADARIGGPLTIETTNAGVHVPCVGGSTARIRLESRQIDGTQGTPPSDAASGAGGALRPQISSSSSSRHLSSFHHDFQSQLRQWQVLCGPLTSVRMAAGSGIAGQLGGRRCAAGSRSRRQQADRQINVRPVVGQQPAQQGAGGRLPGTPTAGSLS